MLIVTQALSGKVETLPSEVFFGGVSAAMLALLGTIIVAVYSYKSVRKQAESAREVALKQAESAREVAEIEASPYQELAGRMSAVERQNKELTARVARLEHDLEAERAAGMKTAAELAVEREKNNTLRVRVLQLEQALREHSIPIPPILREATS